MPATATAAQPLTLKQALDRALVTNRSLAIKQRKLDAKAGGEIKPLLGMLPKVDLSLSRSVNALHDDDLTFYDTALSLEVKENIDLLGGQYRAYQRKQLEVEADREQLSFAKSKLILDVTAAYLDLALSEKKLQLQKQDLDRYGSLTKATEAKLKVGRVAKIDQLNVKFAASRAENNYLETKRKRNAAKRRLDRLVFAKAASDVVYETQSQAGSQGPYLLADFKPDYLVTKDYGTWLRRRGDIASDTLSWEQAKSQYEEIDYQFVPKLDLVGKWSKNLGPSWLDQPLAGKEQEITSSVALVLSWNLFNGGSDFLTRKENYEKVAIGQMELNEAKAKAADTIDNLQEEITILENLVHSKQQEVALATERFKLSTTKYRLGGLSTDDYLISQKDTLAAEVSFVEATYKLYRNKCELLHQLGLLLDRV